MTGAGRSGPQKKRYGKRENDKERVKARVIVRPVGIRRIGNGRMLVVVLGVRGSVGFINCKNKMNMTVEDLKIRLDASKKAEKVEINIIENRRRTERQNILTEWAKENALYEIGDIIESNNKLIIIDKISANMCYSRPYVTYMGRALTKKFELREDGWVMSIYDDSPDRNITLLEKKQ